MYRPTEPVKAPMQAEMPDRGLWRHNCMKAVQTLLQSVKLIAGFINVSKTRALRGCYQAKARPVCEGAHVMDDLDHSIPKIHAHFMRCCHSCKCAHVFHQLCWQPQLTVPVRACVKPVYMYMHNAHSTLARHMPPQQQCAACNAMLSYGSVRIFKTSGAGSLAALTCTSCA